MDTQFPCEKFTWGLYNNTGDEGAVPFLPLDSESRLHILRWPKTTTQRLKLPTEWELSWSLPLANRWTSSMPLMAQKPLEEIAWMKRLHFFWGAVPRDSKTHRNALHQPSRCQVQHQQHQNCWEAPRNTLIYWASRIWGTSGICLSGCSLDCFGDSPTPKRKRVPQTRPENGANLGWSVQKFRPVRLSLGKQLITPRPRPSGCRCWRRSRHPRPSNGCCSTGCKCCSRNRGRQICRNHTPEGVEIGSWGMVMPTVLMERFEMHILSLYHCGGNHCLMRCLIVQTTWMRGSHRIGHSHRQPGLETLLSMGTPISGNCLVLAKI